MAVNNKLFFSIIFQAGAVEFRLKHRMFSLFYTCLFFCFFSFLMSSEYVVVNEERLSFIWSVLAQGRRKEDFKFLFFYV